MELETYESDVLCVLYLFNYEFRSYCNDNKDIHEHAKSMVAILRYACQILGYHQ